MAQSRVMRADAVQGVCLKARCRPGKAFKETLIYSVWRLCFIFLKQLRTEEYTPASKKDRALSNETTACFQEALESRLTLRMYILKV
jgi:hypothetical protein